MKSPVAFTSFILGMITGIAFFVALELILELLVQ